MMCFEEWRACVLSNCGQYQSVPLGKGRGGIGDFRLRRRHGIAIAEMECRIDRIDRTREGIRRDDSEYLFLLIQRSGETLVLHNEREELMHPGDCLLMDSTRPAELRYQGRPATFTSVHLPRALCLEGRDMPAIGRRIGATHPLRASLLNLLSDAEGEEAVTPECVYDFVGLMFRAEGRAPAFHDRHARFQRIRDLVERHLAEPDFSIDDLAARAHLSRRQLQRDFADHGTSFTRVLAERRLRLAAEHLRRAGAPLGIAELAFRVGFGDLSHFNRLFRARHGLSPRAYQAGHGAEIS